ncbi:MAG TPA: NYN domain-containing protein [Ktedonobacteraceae bacterium]|nr:NYN domain-containing protein [Ktedonobacteraceae bacterium]
MTTHNHHDQSDADTSFVEPASAPESIIDPSVSAPATDDSPALPSVEQASPLAEFTELVSPSSSVQDEPTATFTDDVPALPSASEAPALASDAQTKSEDAFSLVPELPSTPEITLSAEPVQPVAQSTDALLEPPADSTQILPATNLPEATASASVEAIIATIQDDVTATKDESPSTTEDTQTPDVPAEQVASLASTTSSSEGPEEASTETTFPYASILSFAEPKNDEVRPFSSFIEEFRQSEALQETYVDFSLLTPSTPDIRMPSEIFSVSLSAQTQSESSEAQIPSAEESASAESPVSQTEPQASDVPARPEEKPETEPAPPLHTPITRVSPLLRPASRLRMPRHSTRHPREEPVQEVLPAATPSVPDAPTTSPSLQQPAEQPAEPVVEQPRPARRYRFDRPAASNSTTSTTRSTGSPTQSGSSPSSPQVRSEESREKETTQSRGGASQFGSFSSRQEATATPQSDQGNQPAAKISNGTANQTQEQPAPKFAVAQEQTSSESANTTTAEPSEGGRRRHHSERQQKEHQVANTTPIVAPQSVAEIVMPAEITQVDSVSPEDLPPLEYADLQKASPRRRRRHRSGSTTGNGASIAQGTPEAPAAQVPMLPATPAPAPAPAANVPDERSLAGGNSSVNPFSIVSGYTVSQMNQGNEVTGPFMGPEPSPARGSVVSRDGRTIRAEMQRSSAYPPVARTTHEGGVSSSSLNHLANVVSQSIQQSIQLQTDRMVAEMRRANQAPTSVSVSLPPFPSTERVGVFVDVANLLYSARTLRIAVDFGKLLDFLRGNRRLVRAHAYCPTSPQAGDEQMFLQAVKGLGYRITTKNYKTFSSGAKKADLDLDLCMDVVRLVDGRAVDCIVLVSGDSDFMPMLDYCSDHGVRVEVAAFDEAMSATLRQSCDLFVNLSMLEEIRS